MINDNGSGRPRRGRRGRITDWIGEGENSQELTLSSLVARYISHGLAGYAIVLYMLAKMPLVRKTIIEIIQATNPDVSFNAIRGWLHYMKLRGVLKTTGHGVYTLGPNIRKDLDKARQYLQEAGIDIDKVEEYVGLR